MGIEFEQWQTVHGEWDSIGADVWRGFFISVRRDASTFFSIETWLGYMELIGSEIL